MHEMYCHCFSTIVTFVIILLIQAKFLIKFYLQVNSKIGNLFTSYAYTGYLLATIYLNYLPACVFLHGRWSYLVISPILLFEAVPYIIWCKKSIVDMTIQNSVKPLFLGYSVFSWITWKWFTSTKLKLWKKACWLTEIFKWIWNCEMHFL